MKIPLRYRVSDRLEQLDYLLHERIWLCEIKKSHQVKFSSEGVCIRCDRRVA